MQVDVRVLPEKVRPIRPDKRPSSGRPIAAQRPDSFWLVDIPIQKRFPMPVVVAEHSLVLWPPPSLLEVIGKISLDTALGRLY
jgi:hypothetical protein